MNITICPLISNGNNLMPCNSSCALYMNGECAILNIAQALPEILSKGNEQEHESSDFSINT